MAQGENTQWYSNSNTAGGGGVGNGNGDGDSDGAASAAAATGGGGNSGRSSKKQIQKKVPQRGLGVAQLEKIRLEEQLKKDGSLETASRIFPPNSIISLAPSNSSSGLAVQCPILRPNSLSSSSSVHHTPPLGTDLNSSNRIASSKSFNGVKGEMGWLQMQARLGNGEHKLEGENHRVDHHGFTFRSNMNFPYGSNVPVLPLPGVVQRSQHFQQHNSSSVANGSSTISSSSGLNFRMEPPSNQSYYSRNAMPVRPEEAKMEPPSNQSYHGRNSTPSWPDEVKMLGMKRSYPFSLEKAADPLYRSEFHPDDALNHMSDESASCGNGCSVNNEPRKTSIRQGPSHPSTLFEPNPKRVMRENGDLRGDLLTLALPSAASPRLDSIHKYPISSAIGQNGETSDLFFSSNQEGIEYPFQESRASKSIRPPSFSIFQSAVVALDRSAPDVDNSIGKAEDNSIGKAEESLDLELKL